MKNIIFCIFIIFLFFFWGGIFLTIEIIKQKYYKTQIRISEPDTLIGSVELLSDISYVLTYNFNFCAVFLFVKSIPTVSFVTVGIYTKELLSQKNDIPIDIEIATVISKKNLEFFAYKIIKENDNFLLLLIKEKACFKLDNSNIYDITQHDEYCYAFTCKINLINDYTFEEIFKNNIKGTFEEYIYINDILYLPIKLEKIKLERKQVIV